MDSEMRRLHAELSSQMKRLDECLTLRLQESEARVHANASEEVVALRNSVQPLLDASTKAADKEEFLLAQQKALEAQVLELQRLIGKTENHLQSELHALEGSMSKIKIDERLEEFR